MRRSTLELDPSVALSAWSETKAAEADPWTHYTCKLVTPLYGGGVRAAEVDTAMPIRAAGIRGQLRFWWRIVAGSTGVWPGCVRITVRRRTACMRPRSHRCSTAPRTGAGLKP